MKTYNSKIASNDKVELVMLSLAQDPSAALAWAKKEDFPWPTISSKAFAQNQTKWSFVKEMGNSVPFYMALDADGKVLAKGRKEAVFKAAGLD